jgi:zinc and cadmium transporter
MNIWVNTLLSVFVVSLISLIGVFFLALKKEKLKSIQLILVGFATGGMLGGAFFHLLPESFASFENVHSVSLLLVMGFMLFFVLERFLHWHHNHTSGITDNHIKPFGTINLFADAFHNFLDGILIGAAYNYSPAIGLATTMIVLMHELPQEIGDFGVLIHAGFSTRKALLFNFLSACTAFFGAFLVLLFSQMGEFLSRAILPFAAGGFIYLAAADLIPELQSERAIKKSFFQFIALLLGMGLLYLLLVITD